MPVKHFLQKVALGDFEGGLKPLQFAKSVYFMKEEYFSMIARCRKDAL